MLVNSTLLSIFIQVITGGIDVWGLTIDLPESYKIYNQLLRIELFVQIVELCFYIWLIYAMKNISNITIYRYVDWFITTPTMLFTLMVFLYHRSGMKLTVLSFLKEHAKDIAIVVGLNVLMLGFGLLTEINVLSVNVGVSLGFIPFALYFGYIYWTYIKDKEEDKDSLLPIPRKQFFYYYLVFWSLYGVMAYLPYVKKNTGYNILDLFAKNGFGIIIVYLIWKINKTCKEKKRDECAPLTPGSSVRQR